MDLNSPKDVIVFQHDELAYHPERYPEYNPIYFDGIDVCSLEYEMPTLIDNNIQFYPSHTRPAAGETFIKSPFEPNTYVNIANLNDYIIGAKCNCLFDIARSLGAKSMKGTFKVTQVKERHWDDTCKGKYKMVVEASLSVKSEEENRLNKTFEMSSTLKGKSITIDDWQSARDKAKKYGLLGDPTVVNMLNALHPTDNGGNHDLTQHISCSMSTETNKSLDIVFNLSAAKGFFKLSNDFHSSTKYRYETILDLYFEFPE